MTSLPDHIYHMLVECEFIEDEIDRSRDLCFNRYVVECELAQGLVGCIGYAGF